MYLSSTELHRESKRLVLAKGFKMREPSWPIPGPQTEEKERALTELGSFESDFARFLMEAVEEGLASLGELSKEAIYSYLKGTFEIEKQQIPSKIGEFANALETIFGASATIIELEILKALHRRVPQFRYFPPHKNITFTGYIAALRQHL
jgi:hypothetical protein